MDFVIYSNNIGVQAPIDLTFTGLTQEYADIQCSETQEALEVEEFPLEILEYYVDNIGSVPEVLKKPESTVIISALTVDSLDENGLITITAILEGSEINIKQGNTLLTNIPTTTAPNLELSFYANPGIFQIEIKKFPYMDKIFNIEVT